MAQATDTRRRDFLALTAAVATSVMAARPALALPQRDPDPIHAAIEVHKAAAAVTRAAVERLSVFERELQADGRLGKENRREDEQQRGEEIEAALQQAFNDETDAACLLVGDPPTTMAGALALLQYAVTADKDGETWPTDLQSDDGSKIRSSHYFLI